MPRGWPQVRSALGFLSGWALLDCLMNLRYPGNEPYPWYLLPSLDVVVLLGLIAVLSWRGCRMPAWLRASVVAVVCLTRVFRLAEAEVERHFHRPISLYLDLPLVPELARLLRATVAPYHLLAGLAAAAGALVVLALATWLALGYLEKLLAQPSVRLVYPSVLLAGLVLSPLWPQRDDPQLHLGLFGKSVMVQYAREAAFFLAADDFRRHQTATIADVDNKLRRSPSSLFRLQGRTVLLFFVESYGDVVLRQPEFAERTRAYYRRMSASLAQHGFAMASSLLASPTFGGSSWLAHATLATGVRTENGLAYALLLAHQPPPLTLAGLFRAAGYRTVLVEPGTTRPNPEGVVQGFDRKYYASDLGYLGPSFQWASMPDQYVVDFIHRREIAVSAGPLFVQLVLVSSHAPWSEQPALVDDWQALGAGGTVYRQAPPVRFPIAWSNLEQGGEAYVTSILYDLEVLRRYFVERMTESDALVIVLGDHQPSADITMAGATHNVPVHVLSRDHALVARFITAGFVAGLEPHDAAAAAGLETFLSTFVATCSGPETTATPSDE